MTELQIKWLKTKEKEIDNYILSRGLMTMRDEDWQHCARLVDNAVKESNNNKEVQKMLFDTIELYDRACAEMHQKI